MKINNTKKIIILVVSIFVLIGIVSGVTYSYFAARVTFKGETIGGTTANVDISLSVENISTGATGKLIPISSGYSTLTMAAKGWDSVTGAISTEWNSSNSCKDKKGYTVCQVYEITVKNNSNVNMYLNGIVSSLHGDNMPNLDCRIMSSKTQVNRSKSCISVVDGVTTYDNFIRNSTGDLFTPKEEKKYYIIVFLKDTNEYQFDSGAFNGVVTFSAVGSTGGISSKFH